MHYLFLLPLLLLPLSACSQPAAMPDTTDQRMLPMSATTQRLADEGYRYYEAGSREPYTGILYGKYENGEFLSVQEYVDGIGNGFWIDFDPMGRMECKGTYINNRVEGPVTFYYESGAIKARGQYRHWKRKIGKWTYYNEAGEVVHTMTYTL